MLSIFIYIISFILIITLIVFIHEFGHFITARLFGVKVEEFSIGFGKEIFSRKDRYGTKWKFSYLLLGGYVKMFGDQPDPNNPQNPIRSIPVQQRKQAFLCKKLYQRFLIVLAGPLANYILAFCILIGLFMKFGISITEPKVSLIQKDLPAYNAGIIEGDIIKKIDHFNIDHFTDLKRIVQLSPNIPLNFKILRNNKIISITVIPESKDSTDIFDNKITTGYIGLSTDNTTYKEISFIESTKHAASESIKISLLTLRALKHIITGKRSIDDLSGPIRIAKYSGQVVQKSLSKTKDNTNQFYFLFWFIAMISINLGLINLLPIPVLDGGYLLFYIAELLTGKPIPYAIQQIILKIFVSILITLIILITINDLRLTLSIN
jgi:regulator of sigma E protease